MPLILFGIVAVLAVAFLIIFNAKAASRRRPRSEREWPAEAPSDGPGASAGNKPAADTPLKQAENEPAAADSGLPEESMELPPDMQMAMEAIGAEQPAQPVRPADPAGTGDGRGASVRADKSKDHDYRQALRAFTWDISKPAQDEAPAPPVRRSSDEEYRSALRGMSAKDENRIEGGDRL